MIFGILAIATVVMPVLLVAALLPECEKRAMRDM